MLLCNSYVEELPHCRDILANFLIAHITKMAPIKASFARKVLLSNMEYGIRGLDSTPQSYANFVICIKYIVEGLEE